MLEARDRVGGRTLDHPIGVGHVVEGGGQWVGPGRTRVLALAKDLGIATFPSYQEGKLVLSFSGLRLTRPLNEPDSADLKRVKHLLESLAATVPTDAPWTAEHAKVWDSETVADWLAKNTRDDETKQTFEINLSTELGLRPRPSRSFIIFSTSARPEAYGLSKSMLKKGARGRSPISLEGARPTAGRQARARFARAENQRRRKGHGRSGIKATEGDGPPCDRRDDARRHTENRLHARITHRPPRPGRRMARRARHSR